jgi:hypothetical protein
MSIITELIDYQGFCGGPQAVPAVAAATSAPGASTMDEWGGSESTTTTDAAAPVFHSIQAKTCLEKLKYGWSPWVLDVRR